MLERKLFSDIEARDTCARRGTDARCLENVSPGQRLFWEEG